MSSPTARVLRDGHMAEIDSKELVPGDIVLPSKQVMSYQQIYVYLKPALLKLKKQLLQVSLCQLKRLDS